MPAAASVGADVDAAVQDGLVDFALAGVGQGLEGFRVVRQKGDALAGMG